MVSYLTEELVRQGHQVTLFASGDSVTKARLVPACPRSLRLDTGCQNQISHHLVMLEQVFRRAAEFDIIHFHVDYMHYSLNRREPITHVTTLHGRLDIPDLVPLYREFQDIPVISISDGQREPLPWANWQATVHHGLPGEMYRFREKLGSYLAFWGAFRRRNASIAPSKSPEKSGCRSKLPRRLIEAMACGTPVVAYRDGAVPEVMKEGHTGFVVEGLEDAVEAVRRVPQLSRRRCREVFEKRFTATRMAQDYVQVFKRLIKRNEEKIPEAA